MFHGAPAEELEACSLVQVNGSQFDGKLKKCG
jgi:hypothetical protein